MLFVIILVMCVNHDNYNYWQNWMKQSHVVKTEKMWEINYSLIEQLTLFHKNMNNVGYLNSDTNQA